MYGENIHGENEKENNNIDYAINFFYCKLIVSIERKVAKYLCSIIFRQMAM